jgi:hypothetical protein
MKKRIEPYLFLGLLVVIILGCGGPPVTPILISLTTTPAALTPSAPPGETESPVEVTPGLTSAVTDAPTEAATVAGHLMQPADLVPPPGKLIDDADSSGTGPEGRAPYGDSYKLNRFERPFLQDMSYVPDLDVRKFGISEDADWYYVSIQLVGSDPNNPVGINYGVEIDTNANGYGDTIILAHPPYSTQWSTSTVQAFQDTNEDSAGLSALASDSDFNGDGYETLVFDGSSQENTDLDLAWVRLDEARPGTIQIAFKKSLAGPAFLLGVVTDAGLKDVKQFDYVDHFAETEAGSPIRGHNNFPLGALYALDNTCWEAYGFKSTGFEPKVCQPILQPVNTKPADDESSCDPPPDCGGGPFDPDTCQCQ